MTPADLKAFRVEHQLCQGSLARLLGLARTTLVGYEGGVSPLPVWLPLAIAALHAKVAPYRPCPNLLRRVEQGRYLRVSDAVTDPSTAEVG